MLFRALNRAHRTRSKLPPLQTKPGNLMCRLCVRATQICWFASLACTVYSVTELFDEMRVRMNAYARRRRSTRSGRRPQDLTVAVIVANPYAITSALKHGNIFQMRESLLRRTLKSNSGISIPHLESTTIVSFMDGCNNQIYSDRALLGVDSQRKYCVDVSTKVIQFLSDTTHRD